MTVTLSKLILVHPSVSPRRAITSWTMVSAYNGLSLLRRMNQLPRASCLAGWPNRRGQEKRDIVSGRSSASQHPRDKTGGQAFPSGASSWQKLSKGSFHSFVSTSFRDAYFPLHFLYESVGNTFYVLFFYFFLKIFVLFFLKWRGSLLKCKAE